MYLAVAAATVLMVARSQTSDGWRRPEPAPERVRNAPVLLIGEPPSVDLFRPGRDGVVAGAIPGVAFAAASGELTDDGLTLLALAARELVGYHGPVCITGYAEDDADRATQRAAQVHRTLVELGVRNPIEATSRAAREPDRIGDHSSADRVDISLTACDAAGAPNPR